MLNCPLNRVIPSATGHFNKISVIFYHHDVSVASTGVGGEGGSDHLLQSTSLDDAVNQKSVSGLIG